MAEADLFQTPNNLLIVSLLLLIRVFCNRLLLLSFEAIKALCGTGVHTLLSITVLVAF